MPSRKYWVSSALHPTNHALPIAHATNLTNARILRPRAYAHATGKSHSSVASRAFRLVFGARHPAAATHVTGRTRDISHRCKPPSAAAFVAAGTAALIAVSLHSFAEI